MKARQQRLEWPHTTKNIDFKEKNSKNEQQQQQKQTQGRGHLISRDDNDIIYNVQFQQKIKRQADRKVWPKQEKQQSIETVPVETQMLDLLDKDLKSPIIHMFKGLKETMSKNERKVYK